MQIQFESIPLDRMGRPAGICMVLRLLVCNAVSSASDEGHLIRMEAVVTGNRPCPVNSAQCTVHTSLAGVRGLPEDPQRHAQRPTYDFAHSARTPRASTCRLALRPSFSSSKQHLMNGSAPAAGFLMRHIFDFDSATRKRIAESALLLR